MRSIFKTQGFDTLIGKGDSITGYLTLTGTTVIDGIFSGDSIRSSDTAEKGKKRSLLVNGTVQVENIVIADELIITGLVTAKRVEVAGTLAIRKGCVLNAETILYRHLVAEDGAIINGHLQHLDSVGTAVKAADPESASQ